MNSVLITCATALAVHAAVLGYETELDFTQLPADYNAGKYTLAFTISNSSTGMATPTSNCVDFTIGGQPYSRAELNYRLSTARVQLVDANGETVHESYAPVTAKISYTKNYHGCPSVAEVISKAESIYVKIGDREFDLPVAPPKGFSYVEVSLQSDSRYVPITRQNFENGQLNIQEVLTAAFDSSLSMSVHVTITMAGRMNPITIFAKTIQVGRKH